MFKNVASQTAFFYAYNATTGLPVTGDGANHLCYVSKDAGAVTLIAAASGVPTEVDSTNAKGYYKIALSQAETNADTLLFSAKSSTSNIVVLGAPATVFTYPTTGILAPATSGRTLVVDAAGLADANTVKVGPTGSGTAQTARDIGASVLLSNGTGTGQLKLASGYVAMTWADIAAPTTAQNLSGTTISTSQAIASVSGSVGSCGSVSSAVILPSIPANWLTAAGISAGALNGKGDWLLASTLVFDTGGYPITSVGSLFDIAGNKRLTVTASGAGTSVTFQTGVLPKQGDQMDLVNAPNATAVTAIQSGLATAASLTALAGKFTGITRLAYWLMSLMRKEVDATTVAEVNANNAVGTPGTYSPATDSLDAIAEAAGGGGGGDTPGTTTLLARIGVPAAGTLCQEVESIAGIGGAGAKDWVIELLDNSSNPIQGASVWVTSDAAGRNIIRGEQPTDTFGNVTFFLEPGPYYRWAYKPGITFTNPEPFTVS